MKKRRFMKAAVLAMLFAMAGSSGAFAANQKLGDGSRVTDGFDHQLAAGNLASTSQNYTTVYGYMNTAGGAYSTALGSGLVTEEGNTLYNSAIGTYSTAIGYANNASVGRSTTVGYQNYANVDYATAVGVKSSSSEKYGTAVGYGDSATGQYSTAVGNKSSASGTFATAIGVGEEGTTNSASGIYSSAFGYKNTAASDYAQAFGTENSTGVTAKGAIVMGTLNKGLGLNSNAFGYSNLAGDDQTMAVGVENTTVGKAATTMGYKNSTSAETAMAIGVDNHATAEYAMATGISNYAAGSYAFAEGARNISGAYSAVSMKMTRYTTAIGYKNTATGNNEVDDTVEGGIAGGSTVALGDSNTVTVDNSVALGQSNTIKGGWESVAFGSDNVLNDRTTGIAAAFGGENKVDSESQSHPAAAFGYKNETVGIAVGYDNTGVKKVAKDKTGTTKGETVYVYPVAIGSENEDSGIGTDNTGSGIGYQNIVTAEYTTANAIGTQNTAIKAAAIAIGYNNEAGGDADKENEGGNSNAIGVLNVAGGTNSGAFGYRNYAGAENSIAMGAGNNMKSYDEKTYTSAATGTGTVAVGYNNNAQTANSTVFGYLNNALIFDDRSGMTEVSSGENALFGSENTGYGKDAVALGYKNLTGKGSKSSTYAQPSTVTHHTIAIGNQNTATGVLETSDSVNNGDTIAVGYKNEATENFAKAFGTNNKVYGSYASAFGYDNQIGRGADYRSYGAYAVALGVHNHMGVDSTWSVQYSTAIGWNNYVGKSRSIAAGFSNTIVATNEGYSSVFGAKNTAGDYYGEDTVVGFGNTASSSRGVSIFGIENKTAYTGYSWNENYSSILGAKNNMGQSYSGFHTIFLGVENKTYIASSSSYRTRYSGFLGTFNGVNSRNNYGMYLIGSYNTASGYNDSVGDSIGVGFENYVHTYYSNGGDDKYTTSVGIRNQIKGTTYRGGRRSTFVGIDNAPTYDTSDTTHIGYSNTVYGTYSTAVGQENYGGSGSSSALGKSNALTGGSGIAVGFSNILGGGYGSRYNTAIGTGNTSGGGTYYSSGADWYNSEATAVGSANKARGYKTSAFGYSNTVGKGTGSGDNREHVTTYSSAIGVNNTIKSAGSYSEANYYGNQRGLRSYAIGIDNTTRNNASTALGAENIVGGTDSGQGTYQSTDNYSNYNIAMGVGNQAGGTWYQASGVAAYTGQYNSYYTTAVGFENKVTGYRNAAVGYQNTISGRADTNDPMNQSTYIVTESAALGQSNVIKSVAYRTDNSNTSQYAGGQSSYTLGHDNVTQAPYSTAVGAANTVGGTQAYNFWQVGGQENYELNNTALGTGNDVGVGAFQYRYYGTDWVTTPHNTYAGTGIGFDNEVGSNYVTAAGYGNTIVNGNSGSGTRNLGVYTVTYSAALGQNNRIQAVGDTVITAVSSGDDTYVKGGEYSYAIGYGNVTQFAGSTALGFGNTVGASEAARSAIAVPAYAYFNANTAIGTGNTVGGLFVTDEEGKLYQVSYATGIGVSNEVYGVEGTAVGVGNLIQGSLAGHQNKNEVNRSAALGSRNKMYTTLDKIGTADKVYADVYNYALGNDNTMRGAGNLAVGRENQVGGTSGNQETADAANTALGVNNIVGGTYVDAEHGEANGRYNLGVGMTNRVIGQQNTAIGIANFIEESAGNTQDSKNLTQKNVLLGISNTANYTTYTGERVYNLAIGEGNTMRNAYDLALGFYNQVGGLLETNVGNASNPYHVAVGSENIVAGTNGEANSYQMTAIGSGNTTYGRDSVVIGKDSVVGTVDQEYDTRESAAIGVRATAATMKSLAIGVDVTADTVTGAVAAGVNSTVSGTNSSAFGVNNKVLGKNSLALGTDNEIYKSADSSEEYPGEYTVVVGSNNTSAVTADDTMTGTTRSVIFGVDSTVTGDYGVAFGVQDTAAGGAVAAGFHSSALGEHSLAMGYAQTVTATGAHGTAVGSGYERTEGSSDSLTTKYYGTEVSGVSGAAFGVANLVSGNYATAAGAGYYRHTEIDQEGVDYFFQNEASGDYSAAFGYLNQAQGVHSLAAGTGYVETVDDYDTLYANRATGDYAAALGYANQALANESLAAGGFSKTGTEAAGTDATGATAIGEGYVVDVKSGDTTTTERRYNEATGAGATALGFANSAAGAASTAAGSLSSAASQYATAIGAGILKETKDGDGNVTEVEYIENAAVGEGATALGYANQAESVSSTALGALSKATGVGATAAGAGYTKEDGTLVYNEANGDGAVVYGYANKAIGNNATALGSTITVDDTEWVNQALSAGSTAIGAGNTAGTASAGETAAKEAATALGALNLATGANTVAIGVSNEAVSDSSIFMGTDNVTTADDTNTVAIGTENNLAGSYGLALGTKNNVYQDYGIALGYGAAAGTATGGTYATALGYTAKAEGEKSVAIGSNAQALKTETIAIGTNAKAAVDYSVAIGTDSVTTDSRRQLEKDLETTGYTKGAAVGKTRTTYTVSFGNSTTTDNVTKGIVSRLTGVAEGRETQDADGNFTYGTDAINVKQLKRYINQVPVFYDHRDANATPFTAEGSYITTGDHWLSTDFWQTGITHGKDSTAYGYLANATGETSSALGYNAKAQGKDSIAMAGATATADEAIAIGSGTSAAGIGLGTGTTVTAGTAIGSGATSSETTAVVLGGGNTSGAEYTISVGNGTNNFRIVNLADAQTDSQKSDYDKTAAVNVETMKKVLDTMKTSEAIVVFDDNADGTDWRVNGNRWIATDFDLNDDETLYKHGQDSVGYGYATKATGTNATAVGYGKSASEMTEATGNYASAFGTLNKASGAYALAAGVQSSAVSDYATAVGYDSSAGAAKSTALGYSSKTFGEGATAIGNNASAASKGTLAIGSSYSDESLGDLKTVAYRTGATAIGLGTKAYGVNSLALGAMNTISSAENAMAAGSQNTVGSTGSGAFGVANTVSGDGYAYALGFYNQVSGTGATAMGYANTASGNYATAAGYGSQATATHGFAAGVSAVAAEEDAAAAGSFAYAAGNSSTAVGAQAYATVENSTAIGYQATAKESKISDDGNANINTVSFGHALTDIDPTTGQAYGTEVTSRLVHIAAGVADTDAANVSQLKESLIVDFDETYETSTSPDHRLSTDFGYEDKMTHGTNSTAYGYLANATGTNAVALGYQSYASAGVALGTESVATSDVVSVGHQKGDSYIYIDTEGNVQTGTYEGTLLRRITNVATGVDDNDLINVKQLKDETRTAGIVKWDGLEDANAKHWLATYFDNANFYTPGTNSSAYGYLTKATGANATAFGYAAQALANDGVALGAESVATDNVISIGHAKGDSNAAGGTYGSELTRKIIHVADGTADTDLVNLRTMKTTDPVKTGTTDGGQWLATSEGTSVSYTPGKYASAYGYQSQATGTSSVAFGYKAYVTGNNSVALGAESVASADNVVSVGHTTKDIDPTATGAANPRYAEDLYRRIVNVADGVDDNDLITYAQLKAATVEGGIVDYDTNYETSGKHWLSTSFATEDEKKTLTRGEESVAFGYQAKVAENAARGTALGYNASVTVADGVAVGTDSVASVAGTVSVGHTADDINPLTNEKYNTPLTRIITGLAFGVDDTDAVSVAQLKYTDPVKTGSTAGVETENHYLTTLDPTTNKPGENSVAYGLGTKGAWAPAKQAVAFGSNAYALAIGSVALGADSVSGEANTISLGHTTTDIDRTTGVYYDTALTRKITGVADAIWDEGDAYYNGGTDLVNVKVLRQNTESAPGVVRTTGDEKNPTYNLYTELNDTGKVTPAVQAVAYGKQAYAAQQNAVALGYKSYANVEGGVALGSESVVSEAGTVSIGHKSGDTYKDYDENGNYVEKTYEGALLRRLTGLAFGVADSDAVSVAQMKLTDPVKTGTTEGATETNHWLATPMGSSDYARGENSVAYGYGTAATAQNAVAFGYAALAQAKNSVAVGSDSVATSDDTVSFGHRKGNTKADRSSYDEHLARRIIHVARGVADTDLINTAQLNEATDSIHVIDWDKNRTATGKKWLSTDFGKDTTETPITHGENSTAYSNYANAQNLSSTALGYGATATADNSVALGRYAAASQADTVSVGHTATDINPTTGEEYGTALTQRITNVAAGTAGTDLVNVAQLKLIDPVKTGTNAAVEEENHYLATSFGTGFLGTPGTDSAAYGYRTKAEGDNSVAIGYEAIAGAENAVALGAYSAATEAGTVSVGHDSEDLDVDGTTFGKDLKRKIIHVADGILDHQDENYTGTDLITKKQLDYAAATSGGVVEFNGQYKAQNDHYLSTYIAQDGKATHNATSSAYGFLANVAADATDGAALGYNASVTAANSMAIGAGSVASEKNTISVGGGVDAEGKTVTRRITNAAYGITDTEAENYNNGTDALMVGQLNAFYLPKSGSYDDGTENKWVATVFGSPDYDPGKNSASYGGGGAKATGEAATAFGYGAIASENNSVALGAGSTSAGPNTISVGNAKTKRRITNAQTGTGLYDAVTRGYLDNALRDKAGIVDYDFDYEKTGKHWLATSFLETEEEKKEQIKSGEESAAFGYTSVASGDYAAAFGYGAQATFKNSVALGAGSVVYEENTISVGAKDAERRILNVSKGVADTDAINVSQLQEVKDVLQINGLDDTATFKKNFDALKKGLTGFEGDVQTFQTNVTKFAGETTGVQETLGKNGMTKTSDIGGRLSDAETTLGQLVGGDSVKEGEDSSIIGYGNVTKGDLADAYGYENQATGKQSTAVGATNIAAGDQSSAYGHANEATGDASSAIGSRNEATGDHATATGSKNVALSDQSTAYGSGNTAGDESDPTKTGQTAIGKDNTVTGQDATGIGKSNAVTGDRATGNGYQNTVSGQDAIGTGSQNDVDGTGSAALGFDNHVTGDGALAIGSGNEARGDGTVAIGKNAWATEENGVAIGTGSRAVEGSVAIGEGSVANEKNTVSFGSEGNERQITNVAAGESLTDALTVGQMYAYNPTKSGTYKDGAAGNKWVSTTYGSPVMPGENSTAYGADIGETGDRATVFGYGATAADDDSVVLGAGSTSAGPNTVSVGDAASGLYRKIVNAETGTGLYDAVTLGYLKEAIRDKGGIVDFDLNYETSGEHWLATSFLKTAEEKEQIVSGKESAAYGYQSVAGGDYAAAFGYGAQAGFDNSVALGSDSVVYEANTISVGSQNHERRIVNVDEGVAPTDAVNVSQLNGVKDILDANGIHDGTNIKQDIDQFAEDVGDYKTDVKEFGDNVQSIVDQTSGVAKTLAANGITAESNIGNRLTDAETKVDGLTAGDSVKEGDHSTIAGYGNVTKGDEAGAYGYENKATGDQSTATGSTNVASGDRSSAYGSGNVAGDARDPTKTGQTAMGVDNTVSGQDATGIGSVNTVTGDRATGNGYQNTVSGQDAIGTGTKNDVSGTGSSAYGFDNHVTGDGALAIGSGNEARGDGTVAIGNNAWATGDGGVAMGTGSRAVENSVAIGEGSVATEKGTVSFGNADEGTTKRLVNLKDGEADSDIATKGQLDAVETKVDSYDSRLKTIEENTYNTKFDQMEGLIDQTEKNISKVGAGAAAMAALHPLEFDPSEKISFAFGYGHYKDENAMAVGAFIRPNETVTISLGGSVGNGDNLVNSGVSFALGSGPSGLAARSKAALAKQVNEQDAKIAARDEEIARLRSLISQLEAMAQTEEEKSVAHEMVVRSETAELEELRSMAQQLVATANADQLKLIVQQLSPSGVSLPVM